MDQQATPTRHRHAPSRAWVGLIGVAALALATGCAPSVHSLSGPTQGRTGPNGVVAGSPTPSRASAPASATSPTPHPRVSTPTTSPTTSTPAPTVTVTAQQPTSERSQQGVTNGHPAVSIYRPHGFTEVDFASPSGRIWCGIRDAGKGTSALCNIPQGAVRGSVPPGAEACPGINLDVTSLQVIAGKARWLCSGDSMVDPRLIGGPGVEWDDMARFPTSDNDFESNDPVVVLPYYHALEVGTVRCTSYTAYMTCADTRTHSGFFLSSKAISVTGQPKILPQY